MLTQSSPYARTADTLRDLGYHPMPVMPGAKVPGEWNSTWHPMRQWSKWCDSLPPEFLHDRWTDWPDAGICIAHGHVVGLDVDTDRKDVAEAAVKAVGPSPVRRTGAKGWMGYYRPGTGLADQTARVRWYDADGTITVELLLHGTQSVIPPTIHPTTGKPYRWITEDDFTDIAAADLPELPPDSMGRMDAAFKKLGLTRSAPRRVNGGDYERPAATDHDLEKPFGRSLNDRAMDPAALDEWWPALDLPKTRQRGRSGMWEAIPFWRGSNSGRAVSDRNPNLKATPGGIVDFGADRSYTPIDVVMAARDCSFPAAVEWLQEYVAPETGADFSGITAPAGNRDQENKGGAGDQGPEGNHPPPRDLGRWSAVPVFGGRRSAGVIRPVALPTDAEFEALVPSEPPEFPIGDFDQIPGLLGETVQHIDAAAAVHTEAGAIAVALPLLGAVMGRAYSTPTNLRTNLYTVALGGSGRGKTALVSPAKDLMRLGQVGDLVGQDRLASGSGLLTMLTSAPRCVCFLDEFGHMLQQIGSPGAGVHARQIITEFTQLFSAAGTMFKGTAYASGKSQEIDCPHLCIFGMATPEQFWRAFGSSSLEDGSIARYLVFPVGQTGDKDMDDSAAEDVAKSIRDIQTAISGRITGNMGNAAMTVAPLSEDADAARRALKAKEGAFAEYAELNGVRGGPAILRRVTENALKIALVSAVGRNPERPEISDLDFDIGHALAWWSANVMIANIASHIADNQLERDVNDVERKIEAAGPDGIAKGILKDRCRGIRKRDFQEIVESLEEAGRIVSRRVDTQTKPKIVMVHATSRPRLATS